MRQAIACILMLLIVGCVGVQKPTQSAKAERTSQFTLPQIPAMIVEERERLRYMTEHYWDNYNFADSLLIANDSITGTAIAGYISLLQLNDTTTIRRSIDRTLDRSIAANYDNFLSIVLKFEDYLYDPNSPMRCEDLFIPVLQYVSSSSNVASVDKLRPEQQLSMALKNRVGELAYDFEYTLRSGETRKMHDIKAKYTLLFFNSPDCDDCERVKQFIASSDLIGELCASGVLKILAVYPESDWELWFSASYPKMMINGYDKGQTITKSALYDLRATPTLYLLDNQKNVLLKDVFVEKIEKFLLNKV